MSALHRLLPALGLISATLTNFNPFPYNAGFNIQNVTTQAVNLPSHSWEFGTTAEALLELYNPPYSVFGENPFDLPPLPRNKTRSLSYAASKIRLGSGYSALDDGNGAAGDPASLGVAAVMLGKTDKKFADAADETVRGLLNDVPRFSNGAISHRASVAELWADFMYMVPPFLAYYAADKQDAGLLRQSVDQARLYREILRPSSGLGAWRHIVGPEAADPGLWSSGNGWAAAGMTRVLATVIKAPVAQNVTWRNEAINQLTQYIKEILDAAMAAPKDDGLLRNYLDDTTSPNGFGEISGSSLLASVAYRMVVLRPSVFDEKYIMFGDDIRRALGGRDRNGNPHVTSAGIVTPAVNPLGWRDPNPFTTGSPEGNAFVALMYAAWRDCINSERCESPLEDAGSPRNSTSTRSSPAATNTPGSRRMLKRTHYSRQTVHSNGHAN